MEAWFALSIVVIVVIVMILPSDVNRMLGEILTLRLISARGESVEKGRGSESREYHRIPLLVVNKRVAYLFLVGAIFSVYELYEFFDGTDVVSNAALPLVIMCTTYALMCAPSDENKVVTGRVLAVLSRFMFLCGLLGVHLRLRATDWIASNYWTWLIMCTFLAAFALFVARVTIKYERMRGQGDMDAAWALAYTGDYCAGVSLVDSVAMAVYCMVFTVATSLVYNFEPESPDRHWIHILHIIPLLYFIVTLVINSKSVAMSPAQVIYNVLLVLLMTTSLVMTLCYLLGSDLPLKWFICTLEVTLFTSMVGVRLNFPTWILSAKCGPGSDNVDGVCDITFETPPGIGNVATYTHRRPRAN